MSKKDKKIEATEKEEDRALRRAKRRRRPSPTMVVGEDPERDERLTRRTKDIAEGATTIEETITKAQLFVDDLKDLKTLGFELTEPVSDGYLHLEKEG